MILEDLYKTLYLCPNLNLKDTPKSREFSAKYFSLSGSVSMGFFGMNFENLGILGIIIETFQEILKYSYEISFSSAALILRFDL